MSTFTTAPYSLDIGDDIIATVEAYNDQGYSTPSAAVSSGVQAEKEPQVGPAALRGELTSRTQI